MLFLFIDVSGIILCLLTVLHDGGYLSNNKFTHTYYYEKLCSSALRACCGGENLCLFFSTPFLVFSPQKKKKL